MNKFFAIAAAAIISLTLNVGDAEAAKRMGGGSSTGMQRQATPPAKNTQQAAPAQQQQAGAAAAPAAQPKRSWMGPLAGLAAGLGLAALASHFGFGEGLANFMMIALLAIVVIGVIGFFMRKKAGAQAQGMQYAGAGAGAGGGMNSPRPEFTPMGGSAGAPAAAHASEPTAQGLGNIPADFDAEGFARTAKVNFIRLQEANDAGNLNDIRDFTTPEMFAEIKLTIDERKGAAQETNVTDLHAQVIDVAEEGNRYIVSVHFHGHISEDRGPVESFSEIWHMVKPLDGSRGWVIAGIQQVQ